jgi:hypothetical protein
MTRHGAFLAAIALGAVVGGAPLPALAQQPGRVFRVGVLALAEQIGQGIGAFREGLRDLGYVEGQNITIEYRLAAGDIRRLPAMALSRQRERARIESQTRQVSRRCDSTLPLRGSFGSEDPQCGSGDEVAL